MFGKDVPEMLGNDPKLELSVVDHLKELTAYCKSVKDDVTREVIEKMLDDTEEDHAHWLEQQLLLIGQTGLQNYLQSKAG
jgi:bacterioferritin